MSDLISILVRSRNDEAYIDSVLKSIFEQECPVPFEVVSCDDASEDRTPEIIASYPKVIRLPRPEGPYVPGRRLNYMVRQAHGNIIVFNNADAVPQNRHWLANLTAPLVNGTADAVYGNQLPRPDAAYLVRKDNLRAFGDGKIAATWKFFFSLATSAVKKEDLLAHPFDENIRYSEDVEWAHRRPIRIFYAQNARVEHSHNYTIAELKRRFYGEGSADAVIFGEQPDLIREMLSAVMETCRDFRFLLLHPAGLAELPEAPVRRFIQRFFHWKGVRDHVRRSRKSA
jgi:rhamnosyltransferase